MYCESGCQQRIREGQCLLIRTTAQLHPFEAAPTLAVAVEALEQAKKNSGRRDVYVKSLAGYLKRFIHGREQTLLSSVGLSDIQSWLEPFRGNSLATTLNRISTLFAYGVRMGWIKDNPCDRIERPRIDRQPPRILTRDEAVSLMRQCPTVCKPYLIVCLYAGIRPAEAFRLDWSDVNLEAGHITVNAAASKVRTRRIVPLEPVALAALRAHPLQKGPLAPSAMTIRRWKRKARAVIKGWPADILRHTAASYLLAKHEEAGKVAHWLGNSEKILRQHYISLVTKERAEKFLGL